MTLKIRGWKRLGILLSVLWLVVIISLAAIQYNATDPLTVQFGNGPSVFDNMPIDSERYFIQFKPTKTQAGNYITSTLYVRALNFRKIFSVMSIPLGIIWLCFLSPSIVKWTSRWVKAGFKE